MIIIIINDNNNNNIMIIINELNGKIREIKKGKR